MRTNATLLILFGLLTAAFAGLLAYYPMGYLYATYENLYGEWFQFGAFVGIAVLSVLILRRDGLRRGWFWLLLGLAAFYTAMEEISWGQQIFGWKSSDFFEDNNIQGETNLHNMFTGPISSITKDLLTYALALGMAGYGVVYPLVCRFIPALGGPLQRFGIPNPGLALIPFFIVAAFCELGLFNFNEAELAELYVALAMFFLALLTWRHVDTTERGREGRAVLIGFICVGLISVAMTTFSINSTLSSKRVANRIEAGVKKFAKRYTRIGAYEHAANLYARHAAYEPDSRSRWRRVAKAREKAGDAAGQRAALEKVVAIDVARLPDEGWRASLHRSLYRGYLALGDKTRAQQHAVKALSINRQRLIDNPNGAEAAYSAARTYDLLDRDTEALEQYRRATRLKPSSKKYRQAYAKAQQSVKP